MSEKYLKVDRLRSYLKSCIIWDAPTPEKSSFDVSITQKKKFGKNAKIGQILQFLQNWAPLSVYSHSRFLKELEIKKYEFPPMF